MAIVQKPEKSVAEIYLGTHDVLVIHLTIPYP